MGMPAEKESLYYTAVGRGLRLALYIPCVGLFVLSFLSVRTVTVSENRLIHFTFTNANTRTFENTTPHSISRCSVKSAMEGTFNRH